MLRCISKFNFFFYVEEDEEGAKEGDEEGEIFGQHPKDVPELVGQQSPVIPIPDQKQISAQNAIPEKHSLPIASQALFIEHDASINFVLWISATSFFEVFKDVKLVTGTDLVTAQ
jgi:hypothetical protein